MPDARALARAARDRLRRARRPGLDCDARPPAADAVRPRAPWAAPLRLARRRPARALRLPPHAVLGRAPAEDGFPRGTAPRARDQRARSRRGGDAGAARQSVPDREGAARGADSPRRPPNDGRAHAPPRVRRPPAAGDRRGPRRSSRVRGGGASDRRARRLARARRHAQRRRDRRCARACAGPRGGRARAGTRRSTRRDARADTQLRRRVRPRARGRNVPAPLAGVALPRRRRAPGARRCAPRQAGRDRARPLPLLHRMHAGNAASLSRARSRERRRHAAGGEPGLARSDASLPRGRGAPRDGATAALRVDVAARGRADRARAPSRARVARRGRRGGGECPRARERLGARPRSLAARVPPQDATAPSARRRVPRRAHELQRHRARALLRLLVGVVRRAPARSADDRRRGGREAPRLGCAQRAEQVLRRHPEGARRRAARRVAPRPRTAVPAPVPRRRGERRAHGADRAAAAGARPVAVARPRGARPGRGRVGARVRAAPLRGVVRPRALHLRRPRSRRRPDALGEDRPGRRRDVRRARDRARLQVRQVGSLRAADPAGAALADPAVHAGAARPRRRRAARGALPTARRRAQAARVVAREREGGAAGLRAQRLSRRGRVLVAARDGSRRCSRARAAHPRGRRRPRSARRLVPVVVRPLARVQGGAGVNAEQRAAVDATGRVFVSAGAGTGKTKVLVERFVRAVCDDGLDVTSVLVITYTKRAAGELRSRIRARLLELGRADLARELDGAWISTIHGFCNRVLKTYPLAAGLDPRFRELDEAQGSVLRGEAFEAALAEFCSGGEPERLRLLATYGANGLRRMLTGVYGTLRSAGRELVLELGASASLDDALARLVDAAQCLVDDAAATEAQRAAAAQALVLAGAEPERLLDLGGVKARGERAATYVEAINAVEQAALDETAARDRALLQDLLDRFAAQYLAEKDRESVLDFEDL